MKFEELCGFELKKGNHAKSEDGLCLLEAVAWFEGEPHSDHPKCVCPVIGHFCRSFNDRLDDRRQELVPYVPRLVNTVGTKDVFQSRLQFLVTEFLALGGSEQFAKRVGSGLANSCLPAYSSSFGLSILCDAITIKRPASYCFEVLDGLLAMASQSPGFSTDVTQRARSLEEILTSR